MAGKIIADTLEHSTAGSVTTDYVVNGVPKVWIQLDGTGTVAIDGSLNVSSLNDFATGQYEPSYTNNLNDTNYAITQAFEYTYSGSMVVATYTEAQKATGSSRLIHNAATGGAGVDVPESCGVFHGDLA